MTDPDRNTNIYAYIDNKMASFHQFLNNEYISKVTNLIKIENSKLGDEIANDINNIEK